MPKEIRIEKVKIAVQNGELDWGLLGKLVIWVICMDRKEKETGNNSSCCPHLTTLLGREVQQRKPFSNEGGKQQSRGIGGGWKWQW